MEYEKKKYLCSPAVSFSHSHSDFHTMGKMYPISMTKEAKVSKGPDKMATNASKSPEDQKKLQVSWLTWKESVDN